jgi:ABC-type glycerol-3-phosphate transport system substrate-binding protein
MFWKVKKIMYVGGQRYSVPLDGDVIFGYYRKDALENEEHKKKFKEKYGYDLAPPPHGSNTGTSQSFSRVLTGLELEDPALAFLKRRVPRMLGPIF